MWWQPIGLFVYNYTCFQYKHTSPITPVSRYDGYTYPHYTHHQLWWAHMMTSPWTVLRLDWLGVYSDFCVNHIDVYRNSDLRTNFKLWFGQWVNSGVDFYVLCLSDSLQPQWRAESPSHPRVGEAEPGSPPGEGVLPGERSPFWGTLQGEFGSCLPL